MPFTDPVIGVLPAFHAYSSRAESLLARAVTTSKRTLELATDRYTGGVDSYLNVITAQTTVLNNQLTQVNLQLRQMTSSVQLIKALGGGWDVSQLPAVKDLTAKNPSKSGLPNR